MLVSYVQACEVYNSVKTLVAYKMQWLSLDCQQLVITLTKNSKLPGVT